MRRHPTAVSGNSSIGVCSSAVVTGRTLAPTAPTVVAVDRTGGGSITASIRYAVKPRLRPLAPLCERKAGVAAASAGAVPQLGTRRFRTTPGARRRGRGGAENSSDPFDSCSGRHGERDSMTTMTKASAGPSAVRCGRQQPVTVRAVPPVRGNRARRHVWCRQVRAAVQCERSVRPYHAPARERATAVERRAPVSAVGTGRARCGGRRQPGQEVSDRSNEERLDIGGPTPGPRLTTVSSCRAGRGDEVDRRNRVDGEEGRRQLQHPIVRYLPSPRRGDAAT